jgi:hypothetical protein
MDAIIGNTREHFRKLGMHEYTVEPWEDGLRTSVSETSFEWWYFDCDLDDGSKLTIEFHTKPPYISPASPLTPFLSFTLDHPERAQVKKMFTAAPEAFSAARDRCDVRIGGNVFEGDLLQYRIHVELEGVCAEISMKTSVPCLRAGTGHVFFGEDEARYVAWLPAVPRGDVSARLTIDGHTKELHGTGYHDHNWGNTALRKLVDHWYWGRARIGEYTIITLMFYSHETYGKRAIPAFMLAKGGEVLAARTDNVGFTASELVVNEQSGVPVANRLVYEIERNDSRYVVTFQREKDIFMLDFGKAGAYHRFLGEATLEQHVHGKLVETARAEALWELLYFGPRVLPDHAGRTEHTRDVVAAGDGPRAT